MSKNKIGIYIEDDRINAYFNGLNKKNKIRNWSNNEYPKVSSKQIKKTKEEQKNFYNNVKELRTFIQEIYFLGKESVQFGDSGKLEEICMN